MINVAIIGASGYSGVELLRILTKRNDISITNIVANSSVGRRIDEIYPLFKKNLDLRCETFNIDRLNSVDAVFITLPSGEAMKIVPQLLQNVKYVIDLGGDFRLPSAQLYAKYYNHTHTAEELLGKAVYGLPELFKTEIENCNFVANPGCYPTSIVLPLLPLLKKNIISENGIVVNSLSGVSGAGRQAAIDYSFVEINENVRAYKIGIHQHIPEIEHILEVATGNRTTFSFIPHLLPINRGIYTTIHAKLNISISENEIYEIYDDYFFNAPFVRMRENIPQIKDVVYTNYCDIFLKIEKSTNHIVLISTLDNLLKGAAGQAVQNMNLMVGVPETYGLISSTEKQK